MREVDKPCPWINTLYDILPSRLAENVRAYQSWTSRMRIGRYYSLVPFMKPGIEATFTTEDV